MKISDAKVGMTVTPISPRNVAYGEKFIVTEIMLPLPEGKGGVDGRIVSGRSMFLPSQVRKVEDYTESGESSPIAMSLPRFLDLYRREDWNLKKGDQFVDTEGRVWYQFTVIELEPLRLERRRISIIN